MDIDKNVHCGGIVKIYKTMPLILIMKPILYTCDNLFIDTTIKLFQSWWLMWANVLNLHPKSFEKTEPVVIVMPVFMNISKPY